jgi:hypothetical protein
MKIVINSHNKSQIALDHLLESMKKHEEFYTYDVIIAIGGYYDYPDYKIEKVDNITYIYCNHNSIDYTGLIALYELYSKNEEQYFYLHDTCRVGDDFFKKLKSLTLEGVAHVKLNRNFSMNMGVYAQNLINKFGYYLLTKKNTDESRCMEFKIHFEEDFIFNNSSEGYVLDNYNGWNYTGPTDYYGTGVMRIVEYYPNIDLYKMKANWGQNLETGIWYLEN